MGETVRLVVDQFDPEHLVPGGTDTCIHDLVKFGDAGETMKIVGVTSGNRRLGEWHSVALGGKTVSFMPVAKFDREAPRRVPHSIRLAIGVFRYRRKLRGVQTLQAHRVEVGLLADWLLAPATFTQFIHNDGANLVGSSTESFWRRLPSLYRRIEAACVRRADATVVFSKPAAARLATLGARVRSEPTWFDPGVFAPGTRHDSGGVEVVVVGRLDQQKDPFLAIEVAKRLSKRLGSGFRLSFVGDGPLRADLESAIGESMRSTIRFLGAVSRDEVSRLMARADVLLLTSHYEGSPRVMVEAGACGLPVVATDGADPDHWLDGANGLRVAGRRAEDLAAAVVRAATFDRLYCVATCQDRSATRAVPRVLSYGRPSAP